MIICGIDPGYDRAGYAFIKNINNQVKTLSYGLVSTDKKLDLSTRILELGNDFNQLFTQYKPSHLFIERLFMGRNTSSVLAVSEARGVLRYIAGINNTEIHEIAPNTVKKTITGYGAADKAQMIKAITILLKLPTAPHPDDVADALAIAFCGYLQLQ